MRASLALARLSVRLLPSGHPYRIFVLSLIDHVDGRIGGHRLIDRAP